MDSKQVREAVRDLNNLDEFVRLEAENTIAMNMPEARDLLHEEIVKPLHKDIKLSIMDILKGFKDSSSIDIYIQLLSDDNKWVRRQASSSLTEYGKEAVEPLLKKVDDPNWRVRGGAVWALAKIAEPNTIDVFLKASHDERSFVRSGSVFGLGNIGGDEALARLKELAVSNDSGYVKANAQTFIEKLEN
ncbi:MAG: HEAT repeat domain-containing protein [Methanosphaera sp.]|nr:HEAT repeat domain-containing protein [Methanosphaera sp.]